MYIGEKDHECTQYGQRFAREDILSNHITSKHIAEKPHQCTQCAKAFARRSNLLVDMRTHRKETPWNAPTVGKNLKKNGRQ